MQKFILSLLKGCKTLRVDESIDGLNTVSPQKRMPINFLKLGNHGSYMFILQQLCDSRRSVACLLYVLLGSS